jgi:hypothetical protein
MPFYRFLIHGSFVESRARFRGFYTTRWAWGSTQDKAAQRALGSVARDWSYGSSSKLHDGLPPILEIDSGYRIAPWDIWNAPNRGNTLYTDEL